MVHWISRFMELSFSLWQGLVVSGFLVSSIDLHGRCSERMLTSSGANVRAQRGRVNTIRIVQRWNSGSKMEGDESGSSIGRGERRRAHEWRGLRGGEEIALGDCAHGGRNLHKGRTEKKQFASTQLTAGR